MVDGNNVWLHHPPSTVHHPPSTIHHPPSTIHHPPSTTDMFTGLVEALGVVHRVEVVDDAADLTVGAPFAADLAVGKSVAVNGACLTVIERAADSFRVQAGFETL